MTCFVLVKIEAERCRVMRARAVALGLPDCMQGFVYVETVR